ncbi:hypothetical protein A2Y85_06165 [candidate division WOR-3 bacterium RBG_13_43_14]|uniref:SHSP domain-containing protein n=1 Tax=candidate division WOR-3 bacterium RBG_13_43_14 TaxID=1802590 RepID=A0A1F4UD17_UNCW3|nr:MAG: hypothetical protein A2Y85_06165 [candidate division WOR-3 bacterium RBG_13_43_14]
MNDRNLTLWEPLSDLVSNRSDFDRFLNRFFGHDPDVQETYWMPAIDIAEINGHLKIKAEIPGMKKEDIKVSVKNGYLTISGEKKQEKETKEPSYHRVERYYGQFCRSIALPADVEADKVKAEYKDGLLNIEIPKPESMQPKNVEIEVK